MAWPGSAEREPHGAARAAGKRSHCGQARVAGASTVAAPTFKLFEKPREEVRVEIVEAQFLRWFPEHVMGVDDQMAEGVPVACHGVRAGFTLHEVLGEEPAEKLGKVCGRVHDFSPAAARSMRWAANTMSSGTAVRYQ